ncbi:MAG: hypothetical protein NTV44_02950, partial [Firmicutes bacterium]|nr:hypothetical protein [Bacillota bacterium]
LHPTCMKKTTVDIPSIMRRVTVGNFVGAKKQLGRFALTLKEKPLQLSEAERTCILNLRRQPSVAIREVVDFVLKEEGQNS